MKKMYVGNLPADSSEDSVREMFSAFGTVRSIKVAMDVFSGKCRGFGHVEMEGHEARAAQSALDGKSVDDSGRALRVRFESPQRKTSKGRRRR